MSEKTPEQLFDDKVNTYVPMRIKFFFQRLIHGYDERDMWDPRPKIVKTVLPLLDSFAVFQHEEGLRLPKAFESDPASWLEIVIKSRNAFKIWEPKKKYTEQEAKEMKEGFELFGKHFADFWEREKRSW